MGEGITCELFFFSKRHLPRLKSLLGTEMLEIFVPYAFSIQGHAAELLLRRKRGGGGGRTSTTAKNLARVFRRPCDLCSDSILVSDSSISRGSGLRGKFQVDYKNGYSEEQVLRSSLANLESELRKEVGLLLTLGAGPPVYLLDHITCYSKFYL